MLNGKLKHWRRDKMGGDGAFRSISGVQGTSDLGRLMSFQGLWTVLISRKVDILNVAFSAFMINFV